MSYQPEFKPEPKPGQYPESYPTTGGQPYYPPRDPREMIAEQWRQDGEQLQLLGILYFVLAGLASLGACVPFVYFGIGLAFVGGAAVQDSAEASAGMAAFGGFVFVIGLIVLAIFLVQIVCLFLTGWFLITGRCHLFCFINGCLLLMHAPFGTALGVFTIIVLSRDTVKQRFAATHS
ncbi:hypothetical protein [Anatilimnocola floriformis]|uniref:hypothetical protein n=1 Tax=Anatilimnocola floriformis TaxID=2948575 RepID=UPI0020C4D9A5|nr:hypothetical protein [Anatilimnocola floriformis]